MEYSLYGGSQVAEHCKIKTTRLRNIARLNDFITAVQHELTVNFDDAACTLQLRSGARPLRGVASHARVRLPVMRDGRHVATLTVPGWTSRTNRWNQTTRMMDYVSTCDPGEVDE